MRYYADERADAIAEEIAKMICSDADIGVVLGSGWGGVADFLEERVCIPYGKLEGMPSCGVEGHAGNFVFGKIGRNRVIAAQGRVHLYEGREIGDVVLPISVMKQLGIHTLIITNSAGAINTRYRPGGIMIIEDHINMTGKNPLIGVKAMPDAPVFIDLSNLYDNQLSDKLRSVAQEMGMRAHAGVYVQVLGPSYETPSEICLLRTAGADAVGMSTAVEAVYAKYLSLRVVGLSCISNMGAGIARDSLDHEEVLETLEEKHAKLSRLLHKFISKI